MLSLLYLLTFCRIVIGLVFSTSFVGKVRNTSQFKQTIQNFNLLSMRFSGTAVIVFLSSEFAIVVCMIFGGTVLIPGFLLTTILLTVFCAALASVLVRGLHISCNCFGANTAQVSIFDIWRNIGFILCALIGCTVLSVSVQQQESLGPGEWGLLSLVAITFVMIWTQLGEIIHIFRGA